MLIAHILLSEDYNPKWETESSARGYEIVLGGVRNSISWISVGGNAKVRVPIRVNSPNMLSTLDPMPVEIIQTIDGQLFVNIPGYSEPLLKYSDTPPVNIQFFSFGTYGNTSAKWYYNCQFDGYSSLERQEIFKSLVQPINIYLTGETAERNQDNYADKQTKWSGTGPFYNPGSLPKLNNFVENYELMRKITGEKKTPNTEKPEKPIVDICRTWEWFYSKNSLM
ncbi:uncharacterized protein LOC129912485 [Episyrphus balteatus]|uniref:uncharacterized protein LOC129912485 n=1 Tax=Episyrphus balteatus TaxID=286459 RepID=UPI002485FF34|nr:uncharacterized protein LOC129912485 [Episyrphus balteatus]